MRRTLITPPLKWQLTALPVAPPVVPVIAERGGTQLRTPKPVINGRGRRLADDDL